MTSMYLPYSEFINICNSKHLRIQYKQSGEDTDSDRMYELYAFDEILQYETVIENSVSPSDVSDFETNYKSSANKTLKPRDDLYIPLVSTTSLQSLPEGYRDFVTIESYVATKRTLNEYTPTLPTSGGILTAFEYWIRPPSVRDVHRKDYIEFSVIEGVTEKKLVQNNLVMKGYRNDGYHDKPLEKVNYQLSPGNVTLKLYYRSYGWTNIIFYARYKYVIEE